MSDVTTAEVTATETETGTATQKPLAEQETTKDEPKTFTQEQLSAVVAREVKKAAEAAAKAERERIEAERTDAELSESEKAKKRAADAEQERDAERAKTRRLTILTEARDEADRLGLVFHPGAISDAFALNAFDAVEIVDDKPQGIKDALEALVKAKPHLLNQGKQPPPKAPDLDATRRSTSNGQQLDAAAVAAQAALTRRALG